MEHRQRSPCHAGTLPAGTVAPGSVPAPAADRHRNRGTDHHRPRYAPGRTRRSRSHRQRRQKARAAAHHAPPPWPFSFAHLPALPPAHCPPPAASSARPHSSQRQPPAPTSSTSAPRSPAACLPQRISTTHDRQTAQNQPTAARCRRGQILYLTDISTLQYSRKLG